MCDVALHAVSTCTLFTKSATVGHYMIKILVGHFVRGGFSAAMRMQVSSDYDSESHSITLTHVSNSFCMNCTVGHEFHVWEDAAYVKFTSEQITTRISRFLLWISRKQHEFHVLDPNRRWISWKQTQISRFILWISWNQHEFHVSASKWMWISWNQHEYQVWASKWTWISWNLSRKTRSCVKNHGLKKKGKREISWKRHYKSFMT